LSSDWFPTRLKDNEGNAIFKRQPLGSSRQFRSDFASGVPGSFFPDKTQNIVHFSLEFWIFTHYLVAAKQTEE
jgi:hypothetical protein